MSVSVITTSSSVKQRKLCEALTDVINIHEFGMTHFDIVGVLETLKLSYYEQHLMGGEQ